MAAEDLEKLMVHLQSLRRAVGADETVAIFVFKENGELGVLSALPIELLSDMMYAWSCLRKAEREQRVSPHAVICRPPKATPQA